VNLSHWHLRSEEEKKIVCKRHDTELQFWNEKYHIFTFIPFLHSSHLKYWQTINNYTFKVDRVLVAIISYVIVGVRGNQLN